MKIILEGINTSLVSISETDASDFVNLRNNPAYNKFLSNRNQEIKVEDQISWMKNLTNNFDFKIVQKRDASFSGSIALYDILKLPDSEIYQAEFGRYIATNALSAVESELLILNFGFDVLNLDRIYCNTVKKNEKVWRQHTKLGFKIIGEDFDPRINEVRVMQDISKEEYLKYDYTKVKDLINRFVS